MDFVSADAVRKRPCPTRPTGSRVGSKGDLFGSREVTLTLAENLLNLSIGDKC
jgi:hypothetical protein